MKNTTLVMNASFEWKNGKLAKSEIKSLLGNPCVVRANGKTTNYSPAKGETILIQGILSAN